MTAFHLRETTWDDSDALAELVSQAPDTGRIAVAPRYHAPFVDVARAVHPDGIGVVAEVPGRPGLVGSAWVRFGQCRLDDDLVPYALLNSLVVHPDFRRLGIASEMTSWRLDRVDERDRETLVLAAIQHGNTGSQANAARWANQTTGQVAVTPVPMRSRAPRPLRAVNSSDVVIRAAEAADLEQLAAGIDAFYQSYNLSRPVDAQELAGWINRSPLGQQVNHYVVAVDRSGRIVAGVGLYEESRLLSTEITRMPPLVRLAARAVRVVPKDGTMRNLHAKMVWFAPGRLAAGRQLWQTVRWERRDRGTSILITTDPRDPVRQMLQNPRWLPTTSFTFAVRSKQVLSADRLLDPPS
jgi:GNAT superfamily N-acetyltransferase